MTDDQCFRCKYRSAIGGFPNGEDMFVCGKEGDPRMPFDMEADTFCPCFEEEEE